jgi:hypothetical protein
MGQKIDSKNRRKSRRKMKFSKGDYVSFNIGHEIAYGIILRNNPETAQCLVFVTSDGAKESHDQWWFNVGNLCLISSGNESRTV